jgi:hypothetical protein
VAHEKDVAELLGIPDLFRQIASITSAHWTR